MAEVVYRVVDFLYMCYDLIDSSGLYFIGSELGGGTEIDLRLAVNSDYNKIIYLIYPKNLVSSRVLEDDKITIYGVSYGLYSYESTTGRKNTIPLVSVDKIDQ